MCDEIHPASGNDLSKIDKPNPVKLPPSTWVSVSIKYPALVVLTGVDPLGNLIAVPEMEKGSLTEVYTSRGAGADRVLYLHAAPGVWRIRNTGSVEVTALVLDATCCAALLYGGLNVLAGSFAQTATPLVPAAATFATVGVAEASALAANSARRFLSLENTHATGVISLSFGGPAAVNGSGVIIRPGAFKSWNNPGEDLFRGEVRAISTVAGTNMAIQEAT